MSLGTFNAYFTNTATVMQLELVWEPAVNTEGSCLGEFRGIRNNKFHRANGTSFTVTDAIFKIKGIDGEERDIPLRLESKFAPDNTFGKLAEAFGYTYQPEMKTDSNGFSFLVADNRGAITQTINDNLRKKFLIKMEKNKKNLWDIDVDSIVKV